QEKVIPRYEDNCGSLQVVIEEINDDIDLNICDLTTLCDSLGNIIGLKVDAALFVEDTNQVQNRTNLLQFIDPAQLGIVENGKFKCDIRIVCADSTSELPISVGILIDRSGSMSLPISELDNTERMQASKQAINNFIDNFKIQDSAFIMSFSNNTTLDLDWSNDKLSLKNAVNSLDPYGMTQLYGAILTALDKVSESSNTRRALVVLSDGCNTIEPDWTDSILTIIQNKNIPIYIIALGLSDDPCDIDGRQKMGLMSNASRGKIYDVYSSSELDSVYSKLSSEIAQDECCSIYFDIDPCEIGEKRFVRLFYTPSDTVIITKVISFVCDSCEKIVSGISEENEKEFALKSNINDLNIYPNPVVNNSIIRFNIQTPGYVKIALFDAYGNIKFENIKYYSETGNYFYNFSSDNLSSGVYVATAFYEGFSISRKVIVIR
nr:VWA domain-containing protein [Candidatus Kapabacteria bacterium]